MLKRLNLSMWGLLALALIFSGVAHAQTAGAKKPAATKKAPTAQMTSTGTIASSDATHLVINHTVKGKAEQMTFVLSPETKKDGSMATGDKVTVKYRSENNDKVATMVRSTPATAAKAKSTGTKKAKAKTS